MNDLQLAARLAADGQAFALATVVRCEAPTSARPGARAIVRPDGTIDGWIGGSCAQPLVIREAQAALADGQPRLMRLCPSPGEGGALPGLVEHHMRCHSGGTLDVFIEPVLPAPRLCVVGPSPIARALAALGATVGYEVVAIDPDPGSPDPAALAALTDTTHGAARFVAIATMGMTDEEALLAALRGPAVHVALVASPRRAAKVREYLAAEGLNSEQLSRLRAPAGLDIGAFTAEEIALSILAELVTLRAAGTGAGFHPSTIVAPPPAPLTAVDPVCGMAVEVGSARFTLDHDVGTLYFCCPGCRRAFQKNPAQYGPAIA
jgi:xanthine dehydrogenase accessory factor